MFRAVPRRCRIGSARIDGVVCRTAPDPLREAHAVPPCRLDQPERQRSRMIRSLVGARRVVADLRLGYPAGRPVAPNRRRRAIEPAVGARRARRGPAALRRPGRAPRVAPAASPPGSPRADSPGAARRTRNRERVSQEPDGEGLQVLRLRHDVASWSRGSPVWWARTARASPTSSTPSPGCSASRAPRRCVAARWRTSSSPAPPAGPPLGRAEVTLTIDNSDGALPIEYTEVSITRRMFRSGESEYEINGDSCRLLDIQELLSDSGIGREMHVIVGQGRLDARAARQAGGPAGVHRGGGRRPQAPQAQGKGAAQARRDAGQPQPAHRPHRRAAPPAQAARPAGRGGPAGRRASRPTCATPGCACSPTTWPRCGPRCDKEIADETALRRAARAGRGASTPRCRAGSASWRPRSPRTRRCSPPPRTPGTSSPPCRSGSARSSSWPGSGCGTSAPPRDDERPGRDPEQLEAEAERGPRAGGGAARRAHRRPDPARRGGRAPPGAGTAARRRRAGTGRRGQGDRRPAGGAGPADRPGQLGAGPDHQRRPRRSSGSPPRTPTRWAAPSRRRPSWTRSPSSPPRPTGTTPTWTPGTPRRSPRRSGRRPRVRCAVRRRAGGGEGRRDLEGPRGGARPGAAPQGRRRGAAGPRRRGARPARQPRRRCSPSQPGHEAALAAALGGARRRGRGHRGRRGGRGDAAAQDLRRRAGRRWSSAARPGPA